MAKRVVVFVSTSQSLGGADFSMKLTIEMLREKGVDSIVLCQKECKSTEFFKQNRISYKCLPYKTWFTSKRNVISRRLYHAVKKYYNWRLASKFLHEFRLNNKDIDVICVYNNSFTNNFAMILAKVFRTKYVQHIREYGVEDFGWIMELGTKEAQFEEIEPKASLIVAVSESVKKSFGKARSSDRIKVVYNGVKEENAKGRPKDEKKLRMIIAGRLSEEKGQLKLVEAIGKLSNKEKGQIILDIYGDGPLRDEIEERIIQYHLEKVVFLKGFHINIPYKTYDVGIMASKSEAFGRVTAEYMMNGLVVLATDSGANGELIEDNKDGILYDHRDDSSLVGAIKKIISMNKQERIALARNAVITAKEKYSEDTYKDTIYTLLKKYDIIIE